MIPLIIVRDFSDALGSIGSASLSCCILKQCAESRQLCGRSGQRGIFQLISEVSGDREGGGGCGGRSLS